VTIADLTVNYRTPAEIVDLARDGARGRGSRSRHRVPQAVRETGERPLLLRADAVVGGGAPLRSSGSAPDEGTAWR
jgi:hypothetical protein